MRAARSNTGGPPPTTSRLIPKAVFRAGTTHDGQPITIRLTAHDAAPDNAFIQKAAVNGKPFESTWLPMSLLKEGENRVEFWIGPQPNKVWAANSPPPRFEGKPLYLDMTEKDIPPRPEYVNRVRLQLLSQHDKFAVNRVARATQ